LFIDSVKRSDGVVSIVMANLGFLFINISWRIYFSNTRQKVWVVGSAAAKRDIWEIVFVFVRVKEM